MASTDTVSSKMTLLDVSFIPVLAGSCILVTREGTRPLLVEVQALVDQSPLANPRRVALGLEQNRLSMLLAVMHRHGGVAMFDQDVFLNVVGGVRVTEPAADLPVLLATWIVTALLLGAVLLRGDRAAGLRAAALVLLCGWMILDAKLLLHAVM